LTSPAASWPAAVSERSVSVLARPARWATVLGVFPSALYLQVDDLAPAGLLPVVVAPGLRLPGAVVLGSSLPETGWGVLPGERVWVGDDEVRLPAATIRVVRTWRPVRVPSATQQPAAGTVAAVAALASAPWTLPARRLATAALAGQDLARQDLAGQDLAGQVELTVGAGTGLTPSGDDVLCGVLLALRSAAAADALAHLWSAVVPRLGATTTLSAGLLSDAAQGYAVPAVVRLLSALGDGRETTSGVAAAARAVAAIGHSSGRDLLAGLVGGLDSVRHHRQGRTLHTVVLKHFPTACTGVAP
jgi:hypothetical protein